MKRLLRVSILSLLCALCALVPTLAARADSVALLGERAYTDYDLGNACPTATVGSALDWLEDLLDDEVGYISEAATDLLELVAIGEGLSDVTPEIATFAESRVMKASEIRSEVQFFYDRLINANVQIPVLEEQIRSGEFDQATIDEMKADLDELTHETQKLLDS